MSPTAALVLDTNVLLVANGDNAEASDSCQLACIEALETVKRGHRLVLDDRAEIVEEYRKRLKRAEQRVGWAFLRWIYDHQFNPDRCELVAISKHPGRGYEAFPEDPELERFDPDDRKFVAVALISPLRPPVVNAVDRDWWDFEAALRQNGVTVQFACEDQLDRWRRERPRK